MNLDERKEYLINQLLQLGVYKINQTQLFQLSCHHLEKEYIKTINEHGRDERI